MSFLSFYNLINSNSVTFYIMNMARSGPPPRVVKGKVASTVSWQPIQSLNH